MKVAAVVYVDPAPHYHMEYLLLCASAAVSSPDLTIVAFHPPAHPPPPQPNAIPIPWTPLTTTDPRWGVHPFINSIAPLADPACTPHLSSYDFLIRTDTDCFFAPGFSTLPPPTSHIYFRHAAGYMLKQTCQTKIRMVSTQVGHPHRGIHSVGPTLYGPTPQMLELFRVAMQAAPLILSDPDCLPDAYPNWCRNVISMYACEVGLNAVCTGLCHPDDPTSSPDPGPFPAVHTNFLDTHADCLESTPHTTAHIHCYLQSTYPFSKIAARQGQYRHGFTNTSREACGSHRLAAPTPLYCFSIFRHALAGTPFAHLTPPTSQPDQPILL